MMMMVELIINMTLNRKNPSITDRVIIDVIHYYCNFTNDFSTILSIDDSASTTTATTTPATANTTNAYVVSNEEKPNRSIERNSLTFAHCFD